jgi:hypothetical protein
MSNFSFSSSTKTKYTLNIERFRGVDFANNPFDVSRERSPDCCNLIPNLHGFPVIRPGAREIASFAGRINGIHLLTVLSGKYRLVHHGENLSLWKLDGSSELLYSGMNNSFSRSVQMNSCLYIFDGKRALVFGEFDGEMKLQGLEDVAYVPTTTIGRKAGSSLGGTSLESPNLLGTRRKNTFCVSAEGESELYLDTAPIVKVNSVRQLLDNGMWVDVTNYEFAETTGIVTISDGLNVTPVSGMDNYEVEFEVNNLAEKDTEKKYVQADAAHVDAEGKLVWKWTSSGKEFWAKKYWYKLGVTDLPLETADVVLASDTMYYHYQYHVKGHASKPYSRQYALTATTTEQSVELGYLAECYDTSEDELDACDSVRVCDVQLVKSGGEWYLTIIEPHQSATGISYNSGYVLDSGSISGVQISFKTSGNAYSDRINHCTIPQVYGVGGNADRLFVTGNSEYCNMDWYSGYNDPTYYPDLGYTKIGEDSSAIMGYSWLSDDTLAIHKASCGSEPTIWLRTSSLSDSSEALFPVKQGAVGKGVVASGCFAHFGGDNLCLSSEGVFAVVRVSNEAVNERFAVNRSWFINPKLAAESDLQNAVAVSFQGCYYLAVNGNVYVADGNAPKTYIDRSGEYQYEWWFWAGLPVRCWYVGDNLLMFGTADGAIMELDSSITSDVCNDEATPISCYWHTPILDFGSRAYYKKIKNAYAIADPVMGSHVKVDYVLESINNQVLDEKTSVFDFDSTDFSDFAFETDEFPRNLPSNTKAKKVMFMQFKLYNEPGVPFGIYGFTVLYTMGSKYKG